MDTGPKSATQEVVEQGACLWAGRLPSGQIEALLGILGNGPLRRPVPLETLRPWIEDTDLPAWIAGILGPGAQLVRALLMGKTAQDNWAIPFHQDTTVAVKAYRDTPGFGPWVNKAHFYHAQAPAEVMARVLSVRLHLDACGKGSGPLKWIPGSHRFGKLDAAGIAKLVAEGPIETLEAGRGEMLFMNPLVLHGSDRAAAAAAPRRVLHLEWANFALPGGLEWAWF